MNGSGPASKLLGAIVVACSMIAAVPARADSTAPAYGVEPREAPANSVPLSKGAGAPPTAAAPAAAPTAAAPSNASSTPPPVPAGATPEAAPAPPPGAQTDVADDDPRALQDFKPRLDPYGSWVQDPKYGMLWVPDRSVVGEDFSPYVTNGHWALDTDDNWVWVSDYPFGDVVFHYGRWAWSSYGWAWIPGYQYAPAWVDWRVPDGGDYAYLGWSPMPPSFIWWGGVGVGLWWAPPYYWAFCPSRYIFARYPGYYVVHNAGYVRTIAGYTRHYVPASARVGGPSLAAARVPNGAGPTSRIAASAHFNGYATHTMARTAAYGGARSYAGSAAAYRGSYAPARTYGSAYGSRTIGSSYYGGARTYSAPRAYTGTGSYYGGARTYSAPSYSTSRMYAPSSRVYSSPSYHAAPSYRPSFSAPHYSVPHSYGGGGGGHFGGGGGGHFGGGGGGHFGGGGHGGGHR